MSSSRFASASISRQVVVAGGVLMLLAGASVAQAQTTPVVKPGAVVQDHEPGQDAQKPAEDPRFVGSAGPMMILVAIKPDKTADFEMVMAKLKEAIATPDKPDDPSATPEAAKAAADLKARKAQWRKMAETWSVLKVAEPMSGNVLYIWNLNPAIEGASYNPIPILYDNLSREEADVLYGKLGGALANLIKWTAVKLQDMK